MSAIKQGNIIFACSQNGFIMLIKPNQTLDVKAKFEFEELGNILSIQETING